MSWKIINNRLTKVYQLVDLSAIIKKLNVLDVHANEQNHHPDFCVFDYTKIRFELSTHDEDSVTAKDYKLAETIDTLFS